MTEPMIEATDEELLESIDELSDEALDRNDGTHFGSGWTFTSCMS